MFEHSINCTLAVLACHKFSYSWQGSHNDIAEIFLRSGNVKNNNRSLFGLNKLTGQELQVDMDTYEMLRFERNAQIDDMTRLLECD